MKMRRFSGTDMRDALRQVREALGPEAVILETLRTAHGVEISAATDGELPFAAPATRPADSPGLAAYAHILNQGLDEDGAAPAGFRSGYDRNPARGSEGACVVVDGGIPAGAWYQPPRPAVAGEVDRLREEMHSLRSLLEHQLSRLVWDRDTRESPERTTLLRNLTQLGLDGDVARRLADQAAAAGEPGNWSAALRCLVQALPVWERDLIDDSGAENGAGHPGNGPAVYAIVGPTGVGKTTTVAKLASRAALAYGADAVGLVTTDTFRVAAREQLETYGQILGIPVHQATDSGSLRSVLAELADRRLVLVDTAGLGQRDPRLAEQLLCLAGGADESPRIRTLLALPAPAHPGTLREIVAAFRTAAPVAAVLTKTDEATSLGAAYSVLIRSGLPLACAANGQRVPEDLHMVRGRQSWLAKMAVELMRRDPELPDEDFLARRFAPVTAPACA